MLETPMTQLKKDSDPILLWQEWNPSNFLKQELFQLNNSIPLKAALSQNRNLQNSFFIATDLPFYSTVYASVSSSALQIKKAHLI